MHRHHLALFLCLIVLILFLSPTLAHAGNDDLGISDLFSWLFLGGAGAAAAGAGASALNKHSRSRSLDKPPVDISKFNLREPGLSSDADLTVCAPDTGSSGQTIIVQAVIHLINEDDYWKIVHGNDPGTKRLGTTPLAIQLVRNDLIKLTLEADSAIIPEPVQTLHWNERLVCFIFDVKLPEVTEATLERFNLRATVNGIPVGRVLFKIRVGIEPAERKTSLTAQHPTPYKRAFLSYASQDRSQVLRAAQLIKALRMNYFQDLLSLEPGDAWRQRLFDEIEQCDVFLLFWSTHARESKWVIQEAEHALRISKSSADRQIEIIPVILEGPPAVTPPGTLEEIHFNDSLRHIIFAEEATAKERKFRHDRIVKVREFFRQNYPSIIFYVFCILAFIWLMTKVS